MLSYCLGILLPAAPTNDCETRRMTTAIISDVHSNLEALTTVLADIDARGITRVVCLGDIVGYGPNPCECLDLIIDRCEWSLMGNHDFAVLFEPTSFNTSAEASAFWTRRQLEMECDEVKRRRRWEFLGNLKVRFRERDKGALWVHASPRLPINEYIFPDDVITAPTKINQIFDKIESRCFVGHTHVTGVFTSEPDFYPPADMDGKYEFNDREKCIINPGSVGQPRDRDPRASYALLTDTGVEFVRLEYDVQATVEKVKQIPELHDFLGMRLIEGR